MKKGYIVILMLLCVGWLTSHATEFTVDGVVYSSYTDFDGSSSTSSNANTTTWVSNAMVIGYTGSSTDVTIPGGTVTYTYSYTYKSKGKTTNAVRYYTFWVDGINASAFAGNTTIETLTIGGNLSWIGEYAFGACTSLKSATINIYDWAEAGYCANSLFYGCTALESVTFNGNATQLTNVGAMTLGDYTFYNCTSLTDVTLPLNISSIGTDAFRWCNSLKGIWVEDGSTYLKSDNGVLYTYDNSELIKCPSALWNENLSYSVLAGTTTIDDQAFENLTYIQKITLPSSVTSVGTEAFSWSKGLHLLDMRAATGLTVSAVDRSNGAYANIPDACFVYLPKGNTSVTGMNIINSTSSGELSCTDLQFFDDDYPVLLEGEVAASAVKLNRTFTSGESTTLMLPFTVSDPSAYGAFRKFDAVQNNQFMFKTVDALVANEPYLFKAGSVLSEIVGDANQIVEVIPTEVTVETGGGGGDSGDDDTTETSSGEIDNPNFESDLASSKWSITESVSGSVARTTSSKYNGSYALQVTSTSAHTATIQQTVSDLATGYYVLSYRFKSSGDHNKCYVQAGSNEKMTSLKMSTSSFDKGYVHGIQVGSDGLCTIKIVVDGVANSSCVIDSLVLTKNDKVFDLLKGGDMSRLNLVLDKGGSFDGKKTQDNVMALVKDKGFNIVRLRLFYDPSKSSSQTYIANGASSPNYYKIPDSYQTLNDIRKLAKSAKSAGMQVLLTIHYSDFWSDATYQNKPYPWRNITNVDVLADSVYAYTTRVMQVLKSDGAIPEYVAVGNETIAGMLYDTATKSGSTYSQPGRCDDAGMTALAKFYAHAYKAIKNVSSDTKVVIHLSKAGDETTYKWYFDALKTKLNALSTASDLDKTGYDIIGMSYYPYWDPRVSVATITSFCNTMYSRYGKEMIIMETGYNFKEKLGSGYEGQLEDVGPYGDGTSGVNQYGESESGQKNFLLELNNEIKKVNGCHLLGYLYWDPIFIHIASGSDHYPGWAFTASSQSGTYYEAWNNIDNHTLFNSGTGSAGTSLPALDAFKYNN